MSTAWLLVAGDLTPLGGMDRANHALARYLGGRGSDVHLVTHRAWADLTAFPGVTVHRIWRPFNRHTLGTPLLSRAGWRVWRDLSARGARAVVNGGNCAIPAANWVHYVHAAWPPLAAGSAARRLFAARVYHRDVAAERDALARAPLIICNSGRTKSDLAGRLGIPESRLKVIYYGSDSSRFGPVDDDQRAAARRAIGQSASRPLVGFVGALGDRRKGFDTLFAAWRDLCRSPRWDANLLVAGTGAELARWRERARAAGLENRIIFLGFRRDVAEVLAACDALVHPARYEAYGLSVHEALCRGLPAIVSASAGIAERYPDTLRDLLIDNPDEASELSARLTDWRFELERYRLLTVPFAAALRVTTWDDMARDIAEAVERCH